MRMDESDSVDFGLDGGKELLEALDVADYLGVGRVTVQRWCRDGSLPAIKVGRSWRVRRGALEEFLYGRERFSGSAESGSVGSSPALTARLRSFLEVPDNVIAISQTTELMQRLDAAFFRAAEARGGTMVKYHAGGSTEADGLREKLGGYGLEVGRLESEGRLRFLGEPEAPARRSRELRSLLERQKHGGSVWAAFDWEERMDLEAALAQQRELTDLASGSRLVVKTAIAEEAADEWPAETWRRTKAAHSGAVWLSQSGLSTSRVLAVPAD